MSIEVKIGDKIPLMAHLECYESGPVYVDAILKDAARVQIGSAVDLGHEGDGIFFDNSVTMPEEDYVTATYRIWQDAGKTIPHPDFCSSSEIFTPAVELPLSNPSFVTSYEVQQTSDSITAEVESSTAVVEVLSETLESVESSSSDNAILSSAKIEVSL